MTTSHSKWGRSQIVTKAAPTPFINTHPTIGHKTYLNKGQDLPPSSGSDGLEHKFFRCKQCGFINNSFVNQPGSGWGNEQAVYNADIVRQASTYDEAIPYDSPNQAYDGVAEGGTYNDVDSGAGCALCGASEYI